MTLDSSSLPRGIVCLQSDDTLNVCNDAFARLEEKASKAFKRKPATLLRNEDTINFNGGVITQDATSVTITHEEHINNL